MSEIQVQGRVSPQPRVKQQKQRKSLPNLRDTALGLVCTQSFPAIVGTADMMLKSAGITLVGYEQIGGGYCTAIVRGNIADVRLAVEEGAKTAEQFGQLVSKTIIARPMPNLEVIFPISSRLADMVREQGYSRLSNQSLGLLETRGFPALVGAADAMLKSADVHLESYTKIGDGLCTAIVRGSVANVAVAIEAGMFEAEKIGQLNAVMVIPRPLEDLEETLPVNSYWLEKTEPLPNLEPKEDEPVVEVVQLPELEKIPVNIKRIQEEELEQRHLPDS